MGSPDDFDFWLGRWRVTWGNGGRGSNVIERDYGGKVIVERFDGNPGTPLRGTSVSVFDEGRGLWQQTWADDAGSYFALEGAFADGEMTLFCDRHNNPNQAVRYRMRFFDIAPDALTWAWASSPDGGATWDELWRLAYERDE